MVVVMLRITALPTTAWRYPVKGAGCAQQRVPEQRDPTRYYTAELEQGEAPGVWHGQALSALGLEDGMLATEADVKSVFGKLQHPDTGAQLGSAPRTFKDYETRLAEALAKEPEASEERQREIEQRVRYGTHRKAVGFYDLTFSVPKSVSVYHAALVTAGEHERADRVLGAIDQAAVDAMGVLEDRAAYTRTGHHGRSESGMSVGKHEQVAGIAWTAWRHTTNRENEPQLHIHAMVANRALRADGNWGAVDGASFRNVKEGIDATFSDSVFNLVADVEPVAFVERPDGKSREIAGIDPRICEAASTRTSQVDRERDAQVESFVERYGREPTPAERHSIERAATLETRADKSHEQSPLDKLTSWGVDNLGDARAVVDAAHDAATSLLADGHPDHRWSLAEDREAVLRSAVADAQDEYSTWTAGNLKKHLGVAVGRCSDGIGADLDALTEAVMAEPARFGAVATTAQSPVPIPAPLQREDGTSILRPPNRDRYATQAQLTTERRIVTQAAARIAPTIEGTERELLEVELAAAGLSDDQAAAVLGIVSSGQAGDVLIGPAGAGKSRTMGTLADVWQRATGGRVMGLATSQVATEQLTGSMEALNTSRFLQQFTPDRETGTPARRQVHRGDLFIIDESGMSSTAELARINDIVSNGGGKILYTGDYEQLKAIGAGGMLRLLAEDNGAYELTQVHRFRHEWERDASLRLRTGDTSVLTEYQDHGRLHGGTIEQIEAEATRAWLGDTLAGRDALLIVGTNEHAARLSARLHAELVRLGEVAPEVLATGMDHNPIGVGDRIEARRNDRSIELDDPDASKVYNRDRFQVAGQLEDGRIIGVRGDGVRAYLPADYVRDNVTLSYTATGHGRQGDTVDVARNIVDGNTGRDGAYVPGTRGIDENHFYVVTERAADEHDPEALATTPHDVLSQILERDNEQGTALQARRDAVAEAGSLSLIGTEWELVTAEYAHDRYTDHLAEHLSPEHMDRLTSDPAYPQLMTAVRGAELRGHSPGPLLDEITRGSLSDARSEAYVLRYRLGRATAGRVPEQQVDTNDWTTLAPPVDGPVGQYTHQLAVLASDRQQQLAHQVAVQPPEWATQRLGPVPAQDGPERAEWIRRAGQVAAYRELAGIDPDATSLGAAPGRERVFERAMWAQAQAALGQPTDTLDYATATEHELREHVDRWRREQSWAPYWVAEDLEAAYQHADAYRHDATLYRAELEANPQAEPAWREQAQADIERAERLAAAYTERGQQLQALHIERARWHQATEPARLAADEAAAELDRRSLPIQPAREQPEQLGLFEIADEHEVGPEPDRDNTPQRHADVEQQQAEPRVEAAADVEREDVVEAATTLDEEPDRDQLELFHVEPTVADRVAAQPLHEQAPHAPDRTTETEAAETAPSVAEAASRAHAAEQQRALREQAEQQRQQARQVAEQARQAQEQQQEQQRQAEAEEAERQRRDTAERDKQQAEQQRATQQQEEREQADDGPTLERVPTPAAEPSRADVAELQQRAARVREQAAQGPTAHGYREPTSAPDPEPDRDAGPEL